MPTYGIVLLFDTETARLARALNAGLVAASGDPGLTLGEETSLPHLSIFQVLLAPEDAVLVGGMLAMAARTTAQLAGTFTVVGPPRPGSPWIFWKTPLTPALSALHRGILKTVAPLRSGGVRVTWPMNDAQKRMYRQHGYPSAGECFDPHLTLGIMLKPGFKPLDRPHAWRAEALALAEIGDQGRVARVIQRFPLE